MPNIFEKHKVLRTLDIYLETMLVAIVAPKTSQKKICNIVLFKAKYYNNTAKLCQEQTLVQMFS